MRKDGKGHPFIACTGSVDVIAKMQVGWQRVGLFLAFPVRECKEAACMGLQMLPITMDKRFDFVVFVCISYSWKTKFELMRVVDAVISTGATSRQEESASLVCSEQLLYLPPLRFPTGCLTFQVFEIEDEEVNESQ